MQPEDTADAIRERYECAPCGLLSTRANGVIHHVNRRFCEWFGYAAQDLVEQKRFQDLLTMGCRIFHQTHWLPLLQMQGSVAEVQLDVVHRDGHTIPVLVNATQRIDAGTTYHDIAVMIATDRRKYERELLHARRQAEELLHSVRTAQDALTVAQARLRLAIDSAELLVWDVDVATGTALYDAGVQRLLGLPAGSQVSADAYQARIHPADRAAERAEFATALAFGSGGKYFAEYRLLGHDDVERVVRSSGRAFFDDAGHLARFSGVLQDVTGWRRAEEVLRERERDAQQRAVLAEQLVGIVSHDLRTPLHAVTLGASLLASGSLEPLQSRTVNRITSATNRANRLITDLLDFTQARLGGGLRVVPTEIDLHAVIADVVEELKLAWPGRMMEHRRAGQGTIVADPDRLSQVVTNLSTNALTYGRPDRPVVITSSIGPHALVIQVHNEGEPIPPELLPYIFEPLRRGEQQVKLGSRSVGLGLYIVQEIANAHRGQVGVESNADAGTTFTLTIPLTDDAD
jgi:sigma-B regulation protein RsbU (phosphoserine phosphatase)